MSNSIGAAKAAVLAANDEGDRAMAATRATIGTFEAQRAALLAAAEGTHQADAESAAQAITRVINHLEEGVSLAAHASSMVRDVAARL